MSNIKIGQTIHGLAERDAIHIAVAPVSCDTQLKPGQLVKFVNGETEIVEPTIDDSDGIVDPFLISNVSPKEKFWVFLNPSSTVGLRHEYVHPAFLNKKDSENWLRKFCSNNDCVSYNTILDVYGDNPTIKYEENGDYITFYGEDAHCDVPPEFWCHLECVLGKKLSEYRKVNYFSCTC